MILHWNWDRSAAHVRPAIGEKHHNEQSLRLQRASKMVMSPIELRENEGEWNNNDGTET
jgi:hypothetical protein